MAHRETASKKTEVLYTVEEIFTESGGKEKNRAE